MQDKPIGVFDSGLGGLTAVKELIKILPNEDIIYFGDTGRIPYGNKDHQTIIKYAKQDINFLLSKDVKFIIAACGTVSSHFDFSSVKTDVHLEGVLSAACNAAISHTKNGHIGVIGTTATIKSNAYKRILTSLMNDVQVYQKDCPELVPLIEKGYIYKTDLILRNYIEEYLSQFTLLGIDTLILGCTHYPIIKECINSVIGNNVYLIDPGKETARLVFKKLSRYNLLSSKTSLGNLKLFLSNDLNAFSRTASLFLGKDITRYVKAVNINIY